jgi:hypothetical protein
MCHVCLGFIAQGNWREMQALLQAMPHLKTANAGEE